MLVSRRLRNMKEHSLCLLTKIMGKVFPNKKRICGSIFKAVLSIYQYFT